MKAELRDILTSLRASYLRELRAYFATPLAYVFVAIFLMLVGVFTWEASRFFDTGLADLQPFFYWHPWLYMIFLPALSMRLWADEIAYSTSELLFSLPVSLFGLATGKLLAAWSVAALSLGGLGVTRSYFSGAPICTKSELRASFEVKSFTAVSQSLCTSPCSLPGRLRAARTWS